MFSVGRAVMPLRKLCCFTMLATIVAFAAAGSLNRNTKKFDVAKPGTPLLGAALPAEGMPWSGGQPANQPGRSHWANAVRTKGELTTAAFVPVQFKDAKD